MLIGKMAGNCGKESQMAKNVVLWLLQIIAAGGQMHFLADATVEPG